MNLRVATDYAFIFFTDNGKEELASVLKEGMGNERGRGWADYQKGAALKQIRGLLGRRMKDWGDSNHRHAGGRRVRVFAWSGNGLDHQGDQRLRGTAPGEDAEEYEGVQADLEKQMEEVVDE